MSGIGVHNVKFSRNQKIMYKMKLESIHVKTFNLTKIILPRIRYNLVAVQAMENSESRRFGRSNIYSNSEQKQ